MSKKNPLLIKISKLLLAAAPAIAVDGFNCSGFIGEPKIPEKLKNTQ